MDRRELVVLKNKINEIINDYLYNVSTKKNHDYFNDSSRIYHLSSMPNQGNGFSILNKNAKNEYIIPEEMFLEGCTRVFLINPIIKHILDMHGIENDWKYGYTFADYTISNRTYEQQSYIEFIAVFDNKRIGFRYTPNTFSSAEWHNITEITNYLFGKTKIPGFEKLSPIDELYCIDWKGILDNKKTHNTINIFSEFKTAIDISVKSFFELFASSEEYDLFISLTKDAIEKARDRIALSAIPQLLPMNILSFKNKVLGLFSKENLSNMSYHFVNSLPNSLLDDDRNIINNNFYDKKYNEAIIGNGEFAKSFITSEYLYQNIINGLSIDYTAVVVGYLKSVEQLLNLYYISAFKGKKRLEYWDTYKKNASEFDIACEKYRFDPYNSQDKQEKYVHKKKAGRNAPEIGELIRFLRYYDSMWAISEEGKEYVYACLDDFRRSCRNSYFHKDNISFEKYNEVERVRNNTYICLYFLLGGFLLLDDNKDSYEQLGIIDYSFEKLYAMLREKPSRFFWATFQDEYEGLIYYLNEDRNIKYNASGMLDDAELLFLKLPDKDTYTRDDINSIIENSESRANATIIVSRKNMPTKCRPASPNRKYRL